MPLRRHLGAPALAIAVILAGGCGDDGGETTATTTTPTTAATTTTTTLPRTPLATPEDTASALIDAWVAGDRAAALAIAVPEAVDVLFAAEAGGVQARGCMQGGFDPTSCVYRTDAGELQIRTTMEGGGWIVDQVRLTENE